MENQTMGSHEQDTSEVKYHGPLLVRRIHDGARPFALIESANDDGSRGDKIVAGYLSESHARLFGAAPDMLTALVEAKMDLEHLCKYADDRLVSIDRITKTTIWLVSAAIAKATGGTVTEQASATTAAGA